MIAEIESIAANPYLVIGSFILAIIGVVIAIIFFVKSKREKRPCYQVYHQSVSPKATKMEPNLKTRLDCKTWAREAT
jgi:hypothetical protein